MRLHKLIGIEYKENIGRILILTLVSIVVTVTGLFWFAQRDLIYGSIDVYKAYGLDGKVLVYGSSFAEHEYIQELENRIKDLSSVKDVYYCDYLGVYNYLEEINDTDGYWFELYKTPQLLFNPYRMKEGNAPTKANEIMISSNVKGIHVGDELHDYTIPVFGSERKIVIKSITVTGIFELNNPLPLDLNSTFQGDYETKVENPPEVLEKWGTAFFVNLVDENNKEVIRDHFSTAFIVTPADGHTDSDVIRELGQRVGEENAYNISRFKRYVEESHEDEMLLFRVSTLVLLVILFTVNVSYCFISLFIRKRDLAVYHVFGLPWKTAVKLYSFLYFPFIIIGYTVGVLLYINKAGIIKDIAYYNYFFTPIAAFIVGAVLIGIYVFTNFSFYILTCNMTPISLLRRE